jgi:hypothetical protein
MSANLPRPSLPPLPFAPPHVAQAIGAQYRAFAQEVARLSTALQNQAIQDQVYSAFRQVTLPFNLEQHHGTMQELIEQLNRSTAAPLKVKGLPRSPLSSSGSPCYLQGVKLMQGKKKNRA